jgi:hypothetical protein
MITTCKSRLPCRVSSRRSAEIEPTFADVAVRLQNPDAFPLEESLCLVDAFFSSYSLAELQCGHEVIEHLLSLISNPSSMLSGLRLMSCILLRSRCELDADLIVHILQIIGPQLDQPHEMDTILAILELIRGLSYRHISIVEKCWTPSFWCENAAASLGTPPCCELSLSILNAYIRFEKCLILIRSKEFLDALTFALNAILELPVPLKDVIITALTCCKSLSQRNPCWATGFQNYNLLNRIYNLAICRSSTIRQLVLQLMVAALGAPVNLNFVDNRVILGWMSHPIAAVQVAAMNWISAFLEHHQRQLQEFIDAGLLDKLACAFGDRSFAARISVIGVITRVIRIEPSLTGFFLENNFLDEVLLMTAQGTSDIAVFTVFMLLKEMKRFCMHQDLAAEFEARFREADGYETIESILDYHGQFLADDMKIFLYEMERVSEMVGAD